MTNLVHNEIRGISPNLFAKPRFWVSLAILLLLGLFVANAHLVMVAVSSQPDCVPHDKVADDSTARMRAAKSGC